MPFVDSAGRIVPESVARDAAGNLRPGYGLRAGGLADGQHLSFDIMHCDTAPAAGRVFLRDSQAPFVGPAAARQAEIADDVARTAAARKIMNDAHVASAVAATMADRSAGRSAGDVAAIRDARYQGFASAPITDNSAAIAALRAARYR